MKTRMQGLIGLGLALMAASAAAAADKPVFGLVMSFRDRKSVVEGKRMAFAPLLMTSIAPSAPSGGSDLLSNWTISIG